MYFQEICVLIQSRTGFVMLPNGKGTLQAGHRSQDAPEQSVLVQETGGETNYMCPDMVNMTVMVVARAKTYFQAREDAWTCFNALHGQAGWNMPRLPGSGSGPDFLAMTIEAIAPPQYIGQDKNGLFEFSTNYIFRCEEGSCGS